MDRQIFRRTGNGLGLVALGLLMTAGSASVFAGTKPSAPSKPAAAPKASAPARPAAGGGAKPGGATTAGHTTGATTASHGPTANGSKTTTTTAGKTTTTTAGKTTTTAGAGKTTTAAAGGKPTAGAGGKPAGGAGNNAKQTGAIKSPAPKGSHETVAKNGATVRTRANGKVADVHDAKRGMDIHHGLDGSRRVSVERHDGSHLVAERGRRGYVERGYHYGGRDYHSRAYYYHGAYYNRYYNNYYYRGGYYNVYAPGYYYGAPFYGWAYNPWAVPVAYGWGWGGSPWLGFYGGYFSPYATYPSAAFWLTDYIISQDLQAAYAARQAAAAEAAGEQVAAASAQAALTPEVKEMIANEVKAQLALENAESAQVAADKAVDGGSSGIARMIADGKPHMFVVGGGLDVTDAASQAECHVSDGDALQMVTPPDADATAANVVVKASKGGVECAPGTTVAVNLTDLQEMQNHMRENLDLGLKELQAKQGKGGLPAAPASAQAAPKEAAYASIAPPPSPDDAKDIDAQTKVADTAEAEVQGTSTGNPTSAIPVATNVTVAMGETPEQVKSVLGTPKREADLGEKVIYFYDDKKVTFSGGKVSAVN